MAKVTREPSKITMHFNTPLLNSIINLLLQFLCILYLIPESGGTNPDGSVRVLIPTGVKPLYAQRQGEPNHRRPSQNHQKYDKGLIFTVIAVK